MEGVVQIQRPGFAAGAWLEYYKELGSTLKKEDLIAEPLQVLFTKDVGGFVSKL
jgi:hypothetical protein